ncbi:hypothetical protein HYV89_03745 [Candidatus Woesearchaeota archaeon]|nr:hypothetical protein [Candidatus Woesearchaeota archaeon]
MKKMVKKKARSEVKMQAALVLLTIMLIILIYYFVPPEFIGYTVLEGHVWSTSNTSNFEYNNEEIEIADGAIKLKANVSTAEWTAYSQEIFPIAKAYYDHEDKTSKVQSNDNDVQEIKPGEMASFVFSTNLNNGDSITIYLDDEEATNIYLCNAYEECTSQNLGQVNFTNQEGDYIITLQNLNQPTKIFNLNSDEEIKLDYINSSLGNITKFWYDPSDKTTKVNAQENTTLEVEENKIAEMIFSSNLQNNDIIQIYLKNEEAANLYLCSAGEECTSSNLGQIYFPNQQGYYNLTIQNLNSASKIFNLNSDEEIKLDYIEAIRVTETDHSETNTTYPETANVTTNDFTVENLMYWDSLVTEEILNGQNIDYEYSANSGESWEAAPEDKNLSAVNSTAIRIRAIFSSNTTATPSISLINITYITEEPQAYYEVNGSTIISTIKDENVTVNSSSSKLELSIVTAETLSNIVLNISNLNDARPSSFSRIKEIEILAPDLQNKISSAAIKIYYTDDEIAGINESTLKIYYYNETSQGWQSLESTVNTEENYIRADVEHFSIYGVFGEQPEQQEASSSSSAGGSGGKREFIRGNQEQPSQQQPQQPQESNVETKSEENIQEQVVQTQAEAQAQQQQALTGNIVRIGKVLATGKTNQSLVILGVILIVAYIIAKIEEKRK